MHSFKLIFIRFYIVKQLNLSKTESLLNTFEDLEKIFNIKENVY